MGLQDWLNLVQAIVLLMLGAITFQAARRGSGRGLWGTDLRLGALAFALLGISYLVAPIVLARLLLMAAALITLLVAFVRRQRKA
jgi:hypothetical protein